MRILALALAVAAGSLLAACASSSKSPQARSSVPAEAGATEPEAASWQLTRKEDIQTHWAEIATWRKGLGLKSEPQVLPAALLSSQVLELRTCEESDVPAETQTCTDICSVKDNICDNAEDICRIAEELGDDAWADEKCVSAKASCKEAKEMCCGCRNGDD